MRRCRCTCEIRLVAGVTRGRDRTVVVVGVALHTGQCRVEASQRVIRIQRVVEGRIRPVRVAVAGVAGVREVPLRMARIGRIGEISDVARVAVLRDRRVVVVDVALRARHGRVESKQWEVCRVIEHRP